MSRVSDRTAARREARARRAELRLFAAARAYRAHIDRGASPLIDTSPDASATPELPTFIERLTELEAAALHFANVVPSLQRRRRRNRR